MKSFLCNIFTTSFRSIEDDRIHKENDKALSKRNHKSATKKIEIPRKNAHKEVQHGFHVPFDPEL